MDTNTKQAWIYIKTLHYYAKEWNEALEDLIYKLIDSMTADNQIQERHEFILGIINLKKKRRIIGNIEIAKRDKNYTEYKDLLDFEINLSDVKISLLARIWYWIPFKLKVVNKDIGFSKLEENVKRVEKCAYMQFVINTLIPIVTFIITILDFIKE